MNAATPSSAPPHRERRTASASATGCHKTIDCYSWMCGIEVVFGMRPFRWRLPSAKTSTPPQLYATISRIGVVFFVANATALLVGVAVYAVHFGASRRLISSATTETGYIQGLIIVSVHLLNAIVTYGRVLAQQRSLMRMGDLILAAERQFATLRYAGLQSRRERWLLAGGLRAFCLAIFAVHFIGSAYYAGNVSSRRRHGAWWMVVILVVLPVLHKNIVVLSYAYQVGVMGRRWHWLNDVLVGVQKREEEIRQLDVMMLAGGHCGKDERRLPSDWFRM